MVNGLPNVLLVEDDPTSKDITKLFLRGICNIDYSPTGFQAIEMLGKRRYDAFLMDINLGRGMGGLEVAKEINHMPEYKGVPIIAITAFAMVGDKEEFLSSGCTHYISKPFTKNQLISLVKEALNIAN